MNQEDYNEVVARASVVIHMAATTNFNENLRLSIELNVLGVCHLRIIICIITYHTFMKIILLYHIISYILSYHILYFNEKLRLSIEFNVLGVCVS